MSLFASFFVAAPAHSQTTPYPPPFPSPTPSIDTKDRFWEPGTPISGGQMTAPTNNLNVAPGATVTCAVTPATDFDHWRTQWSPNGDEADHINYDWTASGGSFSTPGYASTSWTAPATPGTYTLTCTINDDAIIPQGDLQGGSSTPFSTRTDSPVVRTVTVVVVAPKVWDAGSDISGGRMKAPQDQAVDPASPVRLKVLPGVALPCEVEAATDTDHWTKGAQQDIEADTVSYAWSSSGGTVTPDPNDPKKATWTAPAADGTYTLTCTIEDGAPAIALPEEGTRDDDALVQTVEVVVAHPCDMTLSASEIKWNSVLMQWSRCKDDDFVSYKLYRSTTSADFTPDQSNYIDRTTAKETDQSLTSYKDTGLLPLTTYYYALVTSHCGTTTTARKTVTTPDKPPFEVKFNDDQLSRSCAGGIAVDGVHSFVIEGTATNEDGTLVAN